MLYVVLFGVGTNFRPLERSWVCVGVRGWLLRLTIRFCCLSWVRRVWRSFLVWFVRLFFFLFACVAVCFLKILVLGACV